MFMDVKKLLAIVAGALAVVSFFATNPVVLVALAVVILAVAALV